MPPRLLVVPSLQQYREGVRAMMRADAFHVVLGVLIVLLAAGAFGVFAFRQKQRDPAWGWLGVFALLYGTRLLLDNDSVPLMLSMPASAALLARTILTYIILLPLLLFNYYVFPSWRRALRWVIAVCCFIAFAGIVTGIVTGRMWALLWVNSWFVLLLCLAFGVTVFRNGTAVKSVGELRWGAALFFVTIVLGNFRSLGMPGFPFDPEPLGAFVMLIAFGRYLGIRTLESADRLREINKELEIATRIQMSILPAKAPESDRVKIAAKYLPMTAVAGDFYDFLVVDTQRIGILIADVSGHGVPAALIASMVKVATAAQLGHADDPARVLSGMNQTLCGKMQGLFVSAAYLFLDLEKRRCRYAAGGHPPLLWWKAKEQRVEALEENGLLLGILPVASYTFIEREIGCGDAFLLYTDGVVEGSDEAGEFFGETRVCEVLAETANRQPEERAEILLRRLSGFAGYDRGRAQEDDLTVIAVDVK